MPVTESNGLIPLASPTTSHLLDEEIIMAQIQDALNYTIKSPDLQETPEKKVALEKKRKSHKTGGENDDRVVSARKRKKARAERRASQLLESLSEAMDVSMADTAGEDCSQFVETTNELQSVKPPSNANAETVIRPPQSSKAQDKKSALMQSILKDCTPEKVNEHQFRSLTSKSEGETDALTTGSVIGGVKIALNGKLSQDVPTLDLPAGYVPGPEGMKGRYYCPVKGCKKKYAHRRTLIGHLADIHGHGKLAENEDGTMTAILPNKIVKKEESAVDSSASGTIVKKEVVDAVQLPTKQLPSTPEAPNAVIRPPSASKSVPTAKSIRKPKARELDSDVKGQTQTADVKPETSVISVDHQPKKKGRKSVHSTNGTQPDQPKDLYLQGAETVMDSWEIKPGVIRASRRLGGEGFEIEQDIAFSAAHIGSEPNGINLSGVEFKLYRISAGTDRIWAVDNNCDRICSVASGKAHVSIGKKDFSIGAHGLWRVPAGVSCTATNRCYAEAVLHVCTIPAK